LSALFSLLASVRFSSSFMFQGTYCRLKLDVLAKALVFVLGVPILPLVQADKDKKKIAQTRREMDDLCLLLAPNDRQKLHTCQLAVLIQFIEGGAMRSAHPVHFSSHRPLFFFFLIFFSTSNILLLVAQILSDQIAAVLSA
jgi:hypothetical protein